MRKNARRNESDRMKENETANHEKVQKQRVSKCKKQKQKFECKKKISQLEKTLEEQR